MFMLSCVCYFELAHNFQKYWREFHACFIHSLTVVRLFLLFFYFFSSCLTYTTNKPATVYQNDTKHSVYIRHLTRDEKKILHTTLYRKKYPAFSMCFILFDLIFVWLFVCLRSCLSSIRKTRYLNFLADIWSFVLKFSEQLVGKRRQKKLLERRNIKIERWFKQYLTCFHSFTLYLLWPIRASVIFVLLLCGCELESSSSYIVPI